VSESQSVSQSQSPSFLSNSFVVGIGNLMLLCKKTLAHSLTSNDADTSLISRTSHHRKRKPPKIASTMKLLVMSSLLLASLVTKQAAAFSRISYVSNAQRINRYSTRYFSTTKSETETNTKAPKPRNTGGLRRLPVVKNPRELMDTARKVPMRIKHDA
jgi:hypothetical protein